MCNLYQLKGSLKDLERAMSGQLGVRMVLPPGVTPESSNQPLPETVAPKRPGLFLRPTEGGAEPVVGRWGLIPSYHRGPEKAFQFACNNARSETMATSGVFRAAVKARRCLIPMSAFIEWTGPKGGKTKHLITAADGGLLFAAGLWEEAWPEGQSLVSYTMVMTDAREGDDMAPFHDRQPVLLDRERARCWLDVAADYRPLLCGLAPASLAFDPPEPATA